MLDLRTLKVDELKDVAREYGIIGAWKMTKDKLIERILKNAELNGHTNKYFDSAAQDVQDEPENTETTVDDEVIEEPEADESEDVQDAEEKPKKPRGKLIEYNGKAQTLGKWAEELGFTPQTLYARLYLSNWPVDKAFETPSRRKAKEEEEA